MIRKNWGLYFSFFHIV